MKSTAVIVNWNSGARLKDCLSSLSGPEPIVIDNASTDESIGLAREAGCRARIISNAANRGLAVALNQGFAATTSAYVLALNPDVRVTPGAVELLEQILDGSPRVGAVGGYVNRKYLPRPVATPWTVVRENCGFPVPAVEGPEVGQAAAAALLVRRQAYLDIGGFDERFHPAWYEDVDFCKRLNDAGWKVNFARDAEFLHEGGYAARALGSSAFATAYYRNQLRYTVKHFGRWSGLVVRASMVAGMTGRMIAGPSRVRACSSVIVGALGGW